MATLATELIEPKRDEQGRKITPRASTLALVAFSRFNSTIGERESLVRSYEASGLTQKAFAQRERINHATFISWVQDCRRRRTLPKVGFAELTLPRAASPTRGAVARGTIVRGSKAEAVARLLQLIRC